MLDFLFEPPVLRWAREKRFGPKIEILKEQWADSWTEASPDLIAEWESGVGQPTFAQVRRLAEIYKRPLAVFFLDSPPDEKQNPPDLRTIRSQDNRILSPEGLLALRKARRVQWVAADLVRELGEKPKFKYQRHEIEEDPAELARCIRTDLSVSISDQFRLRKFEDFFQYLRGKIEATGAIVLKSGLQDSFPTADCRAFSFADQLPYLILVNNADSEGAKNFSLAHEFAHLLLGSAGICNNFRSFGNRKGTNKIEAFCNQFAASFLVPREQLIQHGSIRGKTAVAPDEVDDLTDQLALAFKVSRVVILRRFLTLGLISPAFYREKIDIWDKETLPQHREGGRYSLKTVLGKNGLAFSSLVLEAYRKKRISYAIVSDYLGVKTKHLSNLERVIDSHAG